MRTLLGNMDNYYGLRTVEAFDQNMPDAIRRTRNAKVRTIDNLDYIIHLAEQFKRTAKEIPEENNVAHAELCEKWLDAIRDASLAMQRALSIEYS